MCMIEINDEQAENIMSNGEMPGDILGAGENVAVILTQDWCPQWLAMSGWLKGIKVNDVNVFYLKYNRKSYSSRFMKVKEEVFRNDLVPYVRYYQNGELVAETNYVGKKMFLSEFEQ